MFDRTAAAEIAKLAQEDRVQACIEFAQAHNRGVGFNALLVITAQDVLEVVMAAAQVEAEVEVAEVAAEVDLFGHAPVVVAHPIAAVSALLDRIQAGLMIDDGDIYPVLLADDSHADWHRAPAWVIYRETGDLPAVLDMLIEEYIAEAWDMLEATPMPAPPVVAQPVPVRIPATKDAIMIDTTPRRGQRSHSDTNPEVVRHAHRLARRNPATGKVRSLRKIAAELAALGYLNRHGKPYAAASIQSMLAQPRPTGDSQTKFATGDSQTKTTEPARV